MAKVNLLVRLGMDLSAFYSGMKSVKAEAEKTGEEVSRKLKEVDTAKAQPGTTLADRVGAMLNPNGVKLITEVTKDNLAEAKRQAEDLSAMIIKLQAKGIGPNSTGADADKFYQVRDMYQEVSYAIDEYRTEVQAAAVAQEAEKQQLAEQTLAAEQTSNVFTRMAAAYRYLRDTSAFDKGADAMRAMQRAGRQASDTVGHLWRSLRKLVSVPVNMLKRTASWIKSFGEKAKDSTRSLSRMVSSIKNMGAVSLGLQLAGAAFGRLRSIVSEYINNNEQLTAQVNGLKSAMGQALAPAIQVVVNLMSQLMPYVLGVANAIGQLVGGLFGTGWASAASGAQKTAKSTKQASDAQKEMNRQLLGFDQITRLEDQSQSASAADTGDAGNSTPTASITAKTPAWMERLKKSFSDLFGSEEFKAANIGGKLGKTLQTGLDWLGTEAMSFNWNGAGKKLRENWDSFWNSGAVESLGRTVGIALAGIGDLIIGFMGPAWNELAQAYKNHGALGALEYIGGMTVGLVGKGISGLFTKLISPMFQGMADFFREHGHQSIAGFFQGLADKTKKIGQDIKTYFVDPIVNGVKNLLGIHSPSTVFAEIAGYCVEGFTQRWDQLQSKITDKLAGLKTSVTDLAAKIKNAFSFSWSLPRLKVPHLSIDWQETGSAFARFFGVSAIPHINVQWYAKGGILDGAQIFGRMGSSLLGGGEAGREAVLPLDRNTEWMDRIADRVVSRLGTGGDVNATINLMVDGKVLVKYVIQGLRAQARAGGSPILGGSL